MNAAGTNPTLDVAFNYVNKIHLELYSQYTAFRNSCNTFYKILYIGKIKLTRFVWNTVSLSNNPFVKISMVCFLTSIEHTEIIQLFSSRL